MNAVRTLRILTGLTQAELASAAGTSQPTIAAYEAGRKSPSMATLRRLADAAGIGMNVVFHSRMTREDRRSLRLHGAIASRLMRDPGAILRTARQNLRLMRDRHPAADSLLREWEVLLDQPVAEVAAALVDPSPRGRELRQVTPFAGVLSASERAEVYRDFAQEEAEL